MSICGMVVRSRIVATVRGIGVPFGGGLVAMGTNGVSMLHF
jgi:hypothetical protein